ncbi:phage major tail tube protein [Jeotgalibacillus terrae]|uniref:Phage major tail tube protein n=1 Tax=Jeotgalibacillus terrae TaxID=587735 RepID=A0ABW5ZFX2_9BACL|nr:phage major tail tube protein [Jeotgalibacillus terrae]MBM7580008.1 P2 family phage contractile tail tube protein [Jeotgalibacillus terrae]
MPKIPEKVWNFKAYDDTDELIGITGEITLPNLEAMSETVSGAGIMGEYESTNPGHFGSLTIELPFKSLSQKNFSLMKSTGRPIVLRAAQQSYDSTAGRIMHRPLKITLKGQPKSLTLGKLSPGAATETTNVMEVLYIKIEENNTVLLELDKLNYVFILDGEDMLKDLTKMI